MSDLLNQLNKRKFLWLNSVEDQRMSDRLSFRNLFQGENSIVMQTFIVMLTFLLFSDLFFWGGGGGGGKSLCERKQAFT